MTAVLLDEAGLVRWGRSLGEVAAREAVFVALSGPLGAGKTRLTQAACAGAGVSEAVTSPTYTLVHWYTGDRGPVAHADLYRIRDASELPGLGWEELEARPGAVFVEWAERAGDELPPDRWEIRFEFAGGGALRRVRACVRGCAPPIPDPAVYSAAPEAPSC
ncbi:tRNA (adenosine(37)-N6)-threonylcarbamoyltransferase complex ATPase subunit type 1 TsaE [Candidatus Palauibacter sp.]|uniref:tRNA (adenosine(37)-N6)-threonylcarbamoyltransferase complex ATPase subunit type 1 TsaE n=1 Tax=Candidatus Palauibacter sp. TaxID=3101350 RepID=UPI003AF25B3C